MKSFLHKISAVVDQFVPPLLLLPLIFIPNDLITSVLWFIADIIFVISVFSFAWKFVKMYKFHRVGDLDSVASIKRKMVRPALAIFIISLATLCGFLSIKSADMYGIEVAKKIQSECVTERICPQIVTGWSDVRSTETYPTSATFYGLFGTEYLLKYTPKNNLTEFDIEVRHSIDESFSIVGGVDQSLSASLWGNGQDSLLGPIND